MAGSFTGLISHDLKQYRAISTDVGDKDGLRIDAGKLHDVLDNYGIASSFSAKTFASGRLQVGFGESNRVPISRIENRGALLLPPHFFVRAVPMALGSFADDLDNQVGDNPTTVRQGCILEMAPDDCTQTKAANYDFVANARQHERHILRPKIFIGYMLILPRRHTHHGLHDVKRLPYRPSTLVVRQRLQVVPKWDVQHEVSGWRRKKPRLYENAKLR
jgi:hypothetical protein